MCVHSQCFPWHVVIVVPSFCNLRLELMNIDVNSVGAFCPWLASVPWRELIQEKGVLLSSVLAGISVAAPLSVYV